MAPRSTLDFRMKADSPAECPRDLAFDRPGPDELMDVAWTIVEDLERAGFTREEIQQVAETMATIVETRRCGRN